MNKYTKTIKKKKLIQRSIRLHKKRLKRKRKRLNKLILKKKELFLINKIEFVPSKPPENFSFIHNTDSYLEYLDSIHKIFKKGKSVNFDLSSLTGLTFGALCLLKAELKDKQFIIEGCHYKGNEPSDEILRDLFRKSGFYSGLYHREKDLLFTGEMINHRKNIKVVEKIAKNVTDEICRHAFDTINPKTGKIYPNIIECMANTHDHAEGNCNWWIFYYKEESTGVTKVCFLDLGIGIFQSLGYRLKGNWQNLGELLGISSNAIILERILNGKMKVPVSSTGKKERGKGLLSLAAFSKEKYVRNLKIISNNVYGHISENIYDTLSGNFDGTFIYWEIIPTYD